jgi:hypothetical protein
MFTLGSVCWVREGPEGEGLTGLPSADSRNGSVTERRPTVLGAIAVVCCKSLANYGERGVIKPPSNGGVLYLY